MAVLNIATPHDVVAVLNRLPEEARSAAFKAANPQLAAEVEALNSDPSRVRKLDVDAAVEAMKWIDDPSVVEALVAADKRQGVRDAAYNRMRTMNRPLTVTSNEKNTLERTSRALAKPTAGALTALAGMSVFSVANVLEWAAARPDCEIAEVVAKLLPLEPLRDLDSTVQLARLAFERVDVLNSGWPALATVLCDMSPTVAAAAAAWEGPWPATLATVFALVNEDECFSARDYSWQPIVTVEAENVWRQMGRWELLLWARLATAQDLPKMKADIRNSTKIRQVNTIASLRDVSLADELIELAEELGLFRPAQGQWYWQGRQLSALCHLAELSDECLLRIFPVMDSYTRDPWLWGTLPHKPSRATVEQCMLAMTPDEVVEMLRDTRTLGDETAKESADRLDWVLGFAFDAIPGLPKQAQQQYYWRRADVLDEFVAARLVEAFGDDANAWSMYWTLYRTGDALTFSEIVTAARAMA